MTPIYGLCSSSAYVDRTAVHVRYEALEPLLDRRISAAERLLCQVGRISYYSDVFVMRALKRRCCLKITSNYKSALDTAPKFRSHLKATTFCANLLNSGTLRILYFMSQRYVA
jgi:hypothetical protein